MRKAHLATLRRRSSCNALFATARPQPRRIFFRSSRRVCVRSRLPWVPAIACPSAPCFLQLCSYLTARVSCDAGPASCQICKKMLESFGAWDEADAADDVVAEVHIGKSQRGEKRRAAPKSMRCGANLGSG